MGESGDHKPVSTSVYSNMEAIDMTAAGKCHVCVHVYHVVQQYLCTCTMYVCMQRL